VNLVYNNKKLDDYILFFLAELDRKFNGNKKTVSLIEKQIVQLLISYSLKSAHFDNDCLYFSLPYSKELAWIDLNWPIDLDPNVKNFVKRKILKIEEKFKNPNKFKWDELVCSDFKLFTVGEIISLKNKKLISQSTWKIVEESLYLLYRKDKELNLKNSEYLFKIYGLLLHRQDSQKTQDSLLERTKDTLSYTHSLKVFSNKEKETFRKLYSYPKSVILYEEESHRQGYDIELIKPNFRRIRISSKTGSFSKKNVIHLSSNRTQKHLTLKDKTNSINHELESISIITACVSVVEGNRKKYLRLALNPKKIMFGKDFKNWETQNKNKHNLAKNWGKYSYDNGIWNAIITESKSHQVDFYIPLELFDVVDEFYLD
jgi:hypothetical protein